MPHAFKANADHPAVDYLVRLHADLGGQVKANKQEAIRLAAALRHVEAVIKLFNPEYNMRAIAARRRHKVNTWFKRGTMGRAVLEMMRDQPEPLTLKQMAAKLLQARGHADPDPQDVKDLEQGIRTLMRASLAKHMIADNSKPARWRLTGVDT